MGALVASMVETLHHRGPDDSGTYISPDGRRGIGISRLKVIDLVTGHQPVSNEDGTIWVVLNGEVYNYRELRSRLERSHRFHTQSDTEVIVHLYEDYGDDFLEHLRGMFAIAVLDTRADRLLLARDRVGKKPLYYTCDRSRGALAFGSEIKALLVDPDVSRQIDPLALQEYLKHGFIPTPRSIYCSIRKLPAGWLGVFDRDGWRCRPYWSMQYGDASRLNGRQAVDEFDRLLTESIQLRLISDVPLGVFLSGGLDSGIVTAIASRLCKDPVQTFTIGFPEKDFDEMADAQKTAMVCHTLHTELLADWHVEDIIPVLARHFDEPFADSSAIPTYRVCQMARPRITVALSGEGGDELLCGYNRYQARKIAEYYNRIPSLLRPRWLENLFLKLPTTATYFGTSWVKSGQYFLEFARGIREHGWQSWLLYFDDPLQERLLRPAVMDSIRQAAGQQDDEAGPTLEQIITQSKSIEGVHRTMWIDFMTYLPDDILVKLDRMSMAVGLECRAPLLDQKLVEWLSGVPLELKLRGLTRKYLLRQLARRYFPRSMFHRPKRGFMMPLAIWLHGSLGRWIRARLEDNPAFAAMCSMDFVNELFEQHRTHGNDHSYRIWSLLMLGEFLRLSDA